MKNMKNMKNNKICIVGLGYVGLPLAHAFSLAGFKVVGFDTSQSRVNELNTGYDRTLELSDAQMSEIKDTLKCSSNLDDIKDCNIYIVTVPTPIDSSNRPDLTPLIKSSRTIGKVLSKDNIVIYESTVYPGATEEDCVPILEKFSNQIGRAHV